MKDFRVKKGSKFFQMFLPIRSRVLNQILFFRIEFGINYYFSIPGMASIEFILYLKGVLKALHLIQVGSECCNAPKFYLL